MTDSRMARVFLVTFAALIAWASPVTAGSVNLVWDASSSAAGYKVYSGTASGSYGSPSDVGSTTQTTIGTMTDCTATFFAVTAYNAAGDSGFSNEISTWPRPEIGSTGVTWVERGQQVALTLSGLNYQPGATVEFSAPQIIVTSLSVDSCSQITMSVSVPVATPIGSTDLSVINANGVTGTGYAFRVEPVGGPDTDPPSIPQGLDGAAASWDAIQLSWSPSTDGTGTGLAGYRVYRDGVPVGTTAQTEYTDTGLDPETSYSYSVSAYDGASPPNESAASASVNAMTSAAPAVVVRINAGGGQYVDGNGQTWSADAGFNTGTATQSSSAIAGTTDDALYQFARWDPTDAPELEYSFSVPNGSYIVNLLLAETYSGAMGVGQRLFDVEIESQLAFDNLDIFAEVGGNTALVKSFEPTVADGQLNIRFIHGVQNPQIAGIEILTVDSGPDILPPDVPQSLAGSPAGPDSISLTWATVSDNGGSGVAGYRVYRDGAEIATTAGNTYFDAGLSPTTTYVYSVSAYDNATPANESARSSSISVTTPAVQEPMGNVDNLRRTDKQ